MEENKIEQQSSTPETEFEKIDKPKTKPKQSRQSIVRGIINDKKALNSVIESKTKTVQQIFSLLERRPEDKTETSKKRIINNPEEILEEIKDNLSKIENQTINDISKVLIASESETQSIQSWLATDKNEVQSLVSEKENLETKINKLSTQLTEEEQKNFFAKLFHKKKREEISAQSRETSKQITQKDALLEEKRFRTNQIKSTIQELSIKQQELAFNTAEQLFQDVVEKHKQLKEKLTSPMVKQDLNADLIAKRILPELEKLQAEKKITKEDTEEYIDLLKIQLAKGFQSDWNDPIERREAIKAHMERLNELNRKSKFNLRDISYRVSSEGAEVADNYYDKIFDFLLQAMTKKQIEQLRDTLNDSLGPKLQERIIEITEEIIYPSDNWQPLLDLNKLHINDFDKLDGLERWQIVKNFVEPSNIIPREIFAHVEKIIIQRLFNEQLFPGGRESWSGTTAAGKICQLGNPEALPLMLRHIEASGSGHTNNAVVYAMEKLLKESNPIELQQVLESLPKSKRILLETLVNENSYMTRFGRIHSHYHTCNLLQDGDFTIAKEQLTKILDEGKEFDEEKLKDFYLSNTEDAPEILVSLLKARAEVEKIIINSKLDIWTQSSDKLLAALVNPRNGESVTFPKRITQEGLRISDEKMLGVIDHIFATKTFKRSGFEREAFLDGLILLNSKENGKIVLETLLSVYRGTKNDPARIRRIFQLLSTLDSFGEYDFATPNQDKINKIDIEINDLQNQYSQTQDKIERKKIKNRIETLNNNLQNLIGLKGIDDVMRQKVAEVACRRLELPQEYQDKIKNNFEELLKSGVFEIVPSLTGKYEEKNEIEVKNLLKTITAHIIEGDFKSWRYAHERSEMQLADLTKEQKDFWKETLEPVIIEVELSENERSRRADELKAAQEIIKNAKEHILDSQPNFDFSKKRAQSLTTKVNELTEKIKFSISEDEKKQLAIEKRTVQAEATLINRVLEIENETPKSFTREKLLTQTKELQERIEELNLPLAGLDIEQIEKIFTVGDIKSITAYESDDPLTLLKVGIEPQETCQSWRSGGFNECLLAYVADSNKKVLNIANDEGKIVARSIIKLTNQKEINDFESKTQRKTLLVENPYSLLPNAEVYRAFIRALLIKAQGLNASITFGKGFDESIIKVFKEEARVFDYGMNESELDVFIPHSLNKYEYSDTLGGKISWFNRYHQLKAITFEKLKT
ncbi:hypothetical protein KKA23_02325 [Patescibacteria group bacterium]|nr:hypothetical protein [Candidatus Micrarchaeota archaeon]MBU2564393.1 hypothetical protein [Patescibacteria group bacterium]